MPAKHIANQPNKPLEKSSDTIHYQEEIFLNVFLSIAKKGIADWEHLRKIKGKDE